MEPHSRDVSAGALQHGAHAALFYSSRAEQTDVLQPFVDAALRANDRLLYVGDRQYGERALKSYGKSGARAFADGQFVIENSADTYMAGGYFDAGRMLAHYGSALEDAIADGYSGLRIAAEMGWSSDEVGRRAALVRYEHVLDRVLGGRTAVVLCQYDRRLFEEETLEALAAAHTHCARPHPLHHSTHLRILRTYEPNGLQAVGEIDVSSRDAFRDALMRVAEPHSGMVVDLSGVKYLDAGSVGAIVRAAQSADGSPIEVRVPPTIHRVFEMLGPTLPRTVRVEEVE